MKIKFVNNVDIFSISNSVGKVSLTSVAFADVRRNTLPRLTWIHSGCGSAELLMGYKRWLKLHRKGSLYQLEEIVSYGGQVDTFEMSDWPDLLLVSNSEIDNY